jgi:hypothetical protein
MNFRFHKGNKWRSECGDFEIKRHVNSGSVDNLYACSYRGKVFALRSYVSEAKHACREHNPS